MSDKKLSDNFGKYSNFNFDGRIKLKAFNRIITFFNISSKEGISKAKEYIQQFDREEKDHISGMLSEINTKGLERVRFEVVRGIKHA